MSAQNYPDNPNAGKIHTAAHKQSNIVRNVLFENNYERKDNTYWTTYLSIIQPGRKGEAATGETPGVLWRYDASALKKTDSDPVAYTLAFYAETAPLGTGPVIDSRGADLPRVFNNWKGRIWDYNCPPRCAGIIENAVFRSKANGKSDQPSRQGTVISGGIFTTYAPTKLPQVLYPRIGDLVIWQPPLQEKRDKDGKVIDHFGVGKSENLKVSGVDTDGRQFAILVPLTYSTFGSASMFRNFLHFLDPNVPGRGDKFDQFMVMSPALKTAIKLCKACAENNPGAFKEVTLAALDRSRASTGIGSGLIAQRTFRNDVHARLFLDSKWEPETLAGLTFGVLLGTLLSDEHYATLLYHQVGKIARDGRVSVKHESTYDLLLGIV
jgi:hypothetical protein